MAKLRKTEVLPILITENKNTQPLLGLDWLDKMEIELQGNKNNNIIRNVRADERCEKNLNAFEGLFKNNHTIEGLTIDIQLKEDSEPIQQRRRLVPIKFQNSVLRELELFGKGLMKMDETTENCFVSPAVIIIKNINQLQ